MSLYHNHHLDIITLLKRRDGIRPLVYSTIIRIASISLVIIFSGIYVYEEAMQITSDFKSSIMYVVLFYFCLTIAKFLFLVLGEEYSFKKGFKHTMRMSIIPFSLFVPLMILGSRYFWLIFPAATMWGAHAGLFWWGYHGYFVKVQNSRSYGMAMGATDFLYTVVAILTPLLGALVITYLGYDLMFVIALILMALSIYILGTDNEKLPKHNTNLKEVLRDSLSRPIELLTLASRGISFEVHGTMWNLYIFLTFGTVLDLGAISSISVLVVSFLTIFIGKYNDKHGEKKSIFIASPMLSIAWVIRFFAKNYPFVIFANALASLGGKTLHISIDEILYKQANDGHTSETLLFRELGLLTGLFIAQLATVVIVLFTGGISALFLLAAVVSLIPIIFAKNL